MPCALCVMSCQLISEMHEADVVDGVEERGCSVLLCMTAEEDSVFCCCSLHLKQIPPCSFHLLCRSSSSS